MSNELINPLQQLITKASKTLPATTGRVASHKTKLDRRQGEVIILADISASMESVAWGMRRKIDVLREAVDAALERHPARLIAFSAQPREVQHIPEPESSTNLTAALRAALQYNPGVTLVISDGQPDNEESALEVAAQFRGVIDVLYVGPEIDRAAMGFMRRLAAAAGGDMVSNDISSQTGAQRLLNCIAGLLPPPSRR
ncbi:VWA domain-containing protein [Pseudomonas aeruginosa]|uniref:vWA domain-containing protein n=1 Tax=Pseudomonas aeruginosa TaxID=287 RepID=UPI001067B400|nr:vWA domain-containing protein [Pseudomonas aeruginosa]TEQ03927.1 VWA domain-containing protein [Pseudomonas aeruginosa]TEQ13232.1 VWA domain-containing protein [Pseudomonas aeruginosa]